MALTAFTKDFVIKSGALIEGIGNVTSSTGQTGTLQVNGGAAITKNLFVGTTGTIGGAFSVTGPSTFQSVTATLLTATTLTVNGNSTVGGTLGVTGVATFSSGFDSQGQTLFNGLTNTFTGIVNVVGSGASFNVQGLAPASFAGIVSISSSTAADTSGNGALKITDSNGGVYIGNNLVVMGTTANTGTTASNALYVQGGLGVNSSALFGGPVVFRDTVTFNGTATYVLSTNTFYTDNILELHTPPDGVYGDWTVDDGKDIGFRFHYFTGGTDTNAALVLDNTSKELHWYNSGAESGSGDFSTAHYGTFRTGQIALTSATNATNTVTGALNVAGGAGFGRDIFVGGQGSFGNIVARNLTTASGLVYNDASGNLFSAPVTWNATSGKLVGVITTATYADNLNGGLAGSIPYQSNEASTTFLPIGSNGYILSISGGAPAWVPTTGLSSGLASTATNIASSVGTTYQIPYQSGPGQTAFNVNLQYNPTGGNGSSGLFSTTNILVVSENNASTATVTATNAVTNGALMVKGGAGIAKDLYVGGSVYVAGNIYLDGVGLDTIQGTTATFSVVQVTGPGNALTITNSMWVGGQSNLQGVTAAILTATTVNATNLNITTPNITGTSTFAGIVYVNNVTPTASTNSGALQVQGGVGIGLGLVVGGITTVTNTTAATSTLTGALQVAGGAGIRGDLYVGGAVTVGLGAANVASSSGDLNLSATGGNVTTTNIVVISNTTPTSGSTNGALIVAGGVGINSGLFVAGITTATTLNVSGNATVGGTLGVTGLTTLQSVTATLFTATTLTVNGDSTIKGTANHTGQSVFQGVTATLFTATTLTVNGDSTIKGTANHTGQSVFQSVTATLFTATTLTVNGTSYHGGVGTFASGTSGTANGQGALVVSGSGGAYIGGSLFVGAGNNGTVTVGNVNTSTPILSVYSNNTLFASYTSGGLFNNSQVNLDNYSTSTYRTAKYVVQIVDGFKIHAEEIFVTHDGSDVYMTEYAIITNTGELGAFNASLTAGLLTMNFTPNYTPTNMVIKLSRTSITT